MDSNLEGTNGGNTPGDELGFDMIAASLRSDASDLATFLDVLGGKLMATLPDNVEVEHPKKKGLFSRKDHSADEFKAESITVVLGDERYLVKRDGKVGFKALIAHEVKGISLKTEELDIDEWIEKLSKALSAQAAKSEKARAALQALLT